MEKNILCIILGLGLVKEISGPSALAIVVQMNIKYVIFQS